MDGGLAQEFSGQRTGIGHHLLHGSEGDHLATVGARTGTEVDDPAGAAHGLVVMLNDEEGITARRQLTEGIQQAGVVTRMESDGRLVQHVEDTA